MTPLRFILHRMGSVFTTDCSHSHDIAVIDDTTFAILPNTMDQLIFFPWMVPTVLSIVISIDCNITECSPIIGYSLSQRKSCDGLDIRNDPNLVFWSLSEGAIYMNGMYHCSTIKCTGNCLLDISWDAQHRGMKLCVTSASGEVQRDQVRMDLPRNGCRPILGTIRVGRRQVVFQVLKKGPKKARLLNITTSTRFTVVGGKMSVSLDGRTISRTSSMQGNSVALLNHVITDGTHCWKLKVKCDFGASICIGLATHNFQVSERYLQDPLKHIYHHKGLLVWRSYRGILYKHGRQMPQSIEPLGWQNNNPVTVQLDLDMNYGTLQIIKNGKLLGEAFRDIRGPVQPAVAFYASYEKEVQLLEFSSSTHVADVTEPDGPAHEPAHSDKARFDSNTLFGGVSLTDDSMTLFRNRDQSGNGYCLLNQTLWYGHYRWSFVIQNDQGASTCVGVAREPIDLNIVGNLYTSPDLYVLRSFQGMLYSEGTELPQRFSEFWLSGSLIEVSFKSNKEGGVLKYSVNGEGERVAFTNIKPPVKPVVGFYSGMEKKVTLVHFEHNTTDPVVSQTVTEKFNDLNIEASSPYHHPLPICLRRSEVANYYDTCMECGAQVNVIALPCKHSMLCADHLVTNESQSCLICEQLITGVWNILTE